jgi:acetyl esterase
VSPAAHNDHSGLPPALVITAELDTLREEGDRFAARLSSAGVPVTHRVFAGVDHAFTHQEPAEKAIDALSLMVASIERAVAT